MTLNTKKPLKAMDSSDASDKNIRGHVIEKNFANLIGGSTIPGTGKADVQLKNLYFSVKGGKKSQIFLHGESTLINSFSDIGLNCLCGCFPPSRADYTENKDFFKKLLATEMKKVCSKFNESNRELFVPFLKKSLFNGEEVDYLSIFEDSVSTFHIFNASEVIEALNELITCITTSGTSNGKVKSCGSQKVIFKGAFGKNNNVVTLAEIEMRNDSNEHYREVKFWNSKKLLLKCLQSYLSVKVSFNKSNEILLYNSAEKLNNVIDN